MPQRMFGAIVPIASISLKACEIRAAKGFGAGDFVPVVASSVSASKPASILKNSEGKQSQPGVAWFGMPLIVCEMWIESRMLSTESVGMAFGGRYFPSRDRASRRFFCAGSVERLRLYRPPGAP